MVEVVVFNIVYVVWIDGVLDELVFVVVVGVVVVEIDVLVLRFVEIDDGVLV